MYNFLIAAAIFCAAGPHESTVSQLSTNFSRDTAAVNSTWLGFKRTDITIDGRNCIIIEPEKSAPGKPWIWRTEFFGHEPQGDSTLAAKGFHVVYMDVQDMYGAPAALDHMDKFYAFLTKKKGLHKKAVLEGFSRGGLFALNWAARHPDRTSCIYLDAPVCDFKSWPGNKGKGPGSADDWEKLKKVYHFSTDEAALEYKYNPVDNLAPLARYKIPILSVCGAADEVVPMDENSNLVKERYEKLGGMMQIIAKEGVGHHPHSLKDPRPIVDFILKYRIK
ncbi:alpha/beta hydrolase [Chitinophaga sp. MM2321]|uniref:alpha/beta hydrolase family protein n=1 Tax=Chitinophaga sp. MM2321 TaxID=3137178 RepID=UPI0032D59245